MTQREPAPVPAAFGSFGALLRHLRLQARFSPDHLAGATGRTASDITRFEYGEGLPDPALVRARTLPALDLAPESPVAAHLLELLDKAHASCDEHQRRVIRAQAAGIRSVILSDLDQPEAVDMARQALAVLPPSHPLYGTIVVGLGAIQCCTGELAAARAVLEQALGVDEPHLALLINRASLMGALATVYRAQGRLRETHDWPGKS